MNQKDPNQKQYNNMNDVLGSASETIGTTPDDLKQKIQNGQVEELMKKLPNDKAKMLDDLLKDPEKAKKMLESPQAKMLMKMFFNNNHNGK